MTAIVVSTNIPSTIATLEAMIAHNIFAAKQIVGGATFNLDGASAALQPYITTSTGYAYDKNFYFNANIYIPFDEQVWSNALNKKPWLYAKEISTNAYPSAYNS